MRISSVILFLISISLSLFSQIDSTDVDRYFENNEGLTDKLKGADVLRHQFKVDLGNIYFGEMTLHYEYALSNSVSAEIGFGSLLNHYNPELGYQGSAPAKSDMGYSLKVAAKYYFDKVPISRDFGFAMIRSRAFAVGTNEDSWNDLSLGYGVQYFFGKRFLLEATVGMGFVFISDSIFVPLSLKIGLTS